MRTPVFALLALVSMSIALGSTLTSVEASTGLGVSPAKLDLGVLDPGKLVERDFTLRSSGDTEIAVEVQLLDYTIDENNTPVYANAGTFPNSSSTWITFTPSRIVLAAGQIGTVKFRIQVPSNTLAGGHYAMAVFKFTTSSSTPNQLAIQGSVAVQVLSQVAGDIQVTGTSTSLGTAFSPTATKLSRDPSHGLIPLDIPFIHEPGPIAIRSRFEVQGNAHLNVAARTWILDWKRATIAQLDLGPYTVLPNSARTLEALWEDPPVFGIFTAYQQVDDSLQTDREMLRFVFIIAPWKSILITLPLLVALIIAVRVILSPSGKPPAGPAAAEDVALGAPTTGQLPPGAPSTSGKLPPGPGTPPLPPGRSR